MEGRMDMAKGLVQKAAAPAEKKKTNKKKTKSTSPKKKKRALVVKKPLKKVLRKATVKKKKISKKKSKEKNWTSFLSQLFGTSKAKKKQNPTKNIGWIFGLAGTPLIAALAIWRADMDAQIPTPFPLSAEVSSATNPSTMQPIAQQNLVHPIEAQAQVAAQTPVQTSVQPVQQEAPITGPLAEEFTLVKNRGIGERVVYWSQNLAESSEFKNNLMKIEGAPAVEDPAALIPKSFDCTTFVETIGALARSKNSGEFYANLISLRYADSTPHYSKKNHFPEADWLPNNQRAGLLEDLTEVLAKSSGFEAMFESKEIKRKEWLQSQLKTGKVSRSIASVVEKDWEKPVQAKVPYLALDRFDQFGPNIPNGAILSIVRKNNSNQPVLITHQGIVLKEESGVFFRHSLNSGSVRKVKLKDYLMSLQARAPQDWPVLGVNISQMRDPIRP